MSVLTLACVVGARPNFPKVAPILHALEAYPRVRAVVVHTGQHYDRELSQVFFDDLGMKPPDVHLGVGSGKHGVQTARVIERFEEMLEQAASAGSPFDRVVVVGDVNSTMAASLAAAKLRIPIAHVEAGLRSYDRTMPEEINRIVTDAIADMLFVSEPAGVTNLRREGHPEGHIHFVGSVMIDTLMWLLPRAKARNTLATYGLEPGRYGVVTLHRPANVDTREVLSGILNVLLDASRHLPLVFPVHPRTKERLTRFGLIDRLASKNGLVQVPPLGYLDFLALTSQARLIVTDSGGLQEESTVLGIPCLTLRPNTEHPITVSQGTNTLVGSEPDQLERCLSEALGGTYKQGRCPALWDGHAADRIAAILASRERASG